MKQRVSIARALAAKSEVFLFDEPFQGLDIHSKEIVKNAIKETTHGKLCIFVSHDKEDAYSVAEHVLFFSGPPLTLEII
jgi:ABC-type nitrate/sulfonate/bicarbonate transport system ATPase subunit